jgi:outer membrane murein-binding lipoprotein Lpp
MNRRNFTLAALSSAVVLAGCDTDQKPSRTATVLNNGEVQRALQNLSSAIASLQGETERFESEDWKDVVPEVQGAAENVQSAFLALRQSLGAA